MTPAVVYQSPLRPRLLAGVERALLAYEVMIVTITVIVFTLSWITVAVTATVLFLLHPFLRRLGAEDPMLYRIYLRTLENQGFYPALAEIDVLPARHRPFHHALY